ncbi:hypothetical protein ACFOJE_19320 [Azotobacter bryophylli]|uniref:Mu-like prophage FluMu N-terminal domain-containing protein n=1 Tax=Azotobacter bryophylli TaxID=1986537 RepID=A0ABV7AXN6_9GAMM
MAKTTAKGAPISQTRRGIFVRSLPPTFRRAGLQFTHDGHALLLDDLSEAQIEAIAEEPLLSVRPCEFPASAFDDVPFDEQAADGAKDPANSEADA